MRKLILLPDTYLIDSVQSVFQVAVHVQETWSLTSCTRSYSVIAAGHFGLAHRSFLFLLVLFENHVAFGYVGCSSGLALIRSSLRWPSLKNASIPIAFLNSISTVRVWGHSVAQLHPGGLNVEAIVRTILERVLPTRNSAKQRLAFKSWPQLRVRSRVTDTMAYSRPLKIDSWSQLLKPFS